MNSDTITAGESWSRKVTVYSDSAHTTPLDLTGASITLVVLDRPGGETVWDGFAEILNTSSGQVRIALSGAQTADRPNSVLYWKVRASLSGSRVADIDDGKLIIKE